MHYDSTATYYTFDGTNYTEKTGLTEDNFIYYVSGENDPYTGDYDDSLVYQTLRMGERTINFKVNKVSTGTKTYTLVINSSVFGVVDSSQSSGYAKYNGEHTITATANDESGDTIDVIIISSDVMNSGGIQFKASSGSIYNTTDLGNVISITTVVPEGKNDINVKRIGSSENPSESAEGGYFLLAKSTNYAANITTITIVFEK